MIYGRRLLNPFFLRVGHDREYANTHQLIIAIELKVLLRMPKSYTIIIYPERIKVQKGSVEKSLFRFFYEKLKQIN